RQTVALLAGRLVGPRLSRRCAGGAGRCAARSGPPGVDRCRTAPLDRPESRCQRLAAAVLSFAGIRHPAAEPGLEPGAPGADFALVAGPAASCPTYPESQVPGRPCGPGAAGDVWRARPGGSLSDTAPFSFPL